MQHMAVIYLSVLIVIHSLKLYVKGTAQKLLEGVVDDFGFMPSKSECPLPAIGQVCPPPFLSTVWLNSGAPPPIKFGNFNIPKVYNMQNIK